MNINKSAFVLALCLGAASFSALADDLIATSAAGKGGTNSVALDFVSAGESVAFEFVVALPKGAKNIDVSNCLKALPASHKGTCAYNEKSNEVIAIAFSTENSKLPSGAIELGMVRYTSLLKGGNEATIRGLVVADGRGEAIQSNIRSEDALLGN